MFDLQSLIKYLLEGLAVAVAAYLIPRKKIDAKEIALIALTAAAIFAVLDQFAPLVAVGARQGAGFGIGFQQVGLGGYGLEGFDDHPIDGMDEGLEGYDDYENEGFNGREHGREHGRDEEWDNRFGRRHEGFNGREHGREHGRDEEWDNRWGRRHEGFQDTTTTTTDTSSQNTTTNPPSTSSTTSDDENVDKTNVCKMNGENCAYDPSVKPEQKAYFLCHKENDQCNPMKACKKDDKGQCDWEQNAKDLPDASGRMCHIEDIGGKKVCRMSKRTEGFYGGSSDEITGFEGFSKVF